MIYELRIYHLTPGRMPDSNKRFDDVTIGRFEKHNKQVG